MCNGRQYKLERMLFSLMLLENDFTKATMVFYGLSLGFLKGQSLTYKTCFLLTWINIVLVAEVNARGASATKMVMQMIIVPLHIHL